MIIVGLEGFYSLTGHSYIDVDIDNVYVGCRGENVMKYIYRNIKTYDQNAMKYDEIIHVYFTVKWK